MMACFFKHKWGKWEQYEWEGKVVRLSRLDPNYAKEFHSREIRQKRICERCGVMEDKKVREG